MGTLKVTVLRFGLAIGVVMTGLAVSIPVANAETILDLKLPNPGAVVLSHYKETPYVAGLFEFRGPGVMTVTSWISSSSVGIRNGTLYANSSAGQGVFNACEGSSYAIEPFTCTPACSMDQNQPCPDGTEVTCRGVCFFGNPDFERSTEVSLAAIKDYRHVQGMEYKTWPAAQRVLVEFVQTADPGTVQVPDEIPDISDDAPPAQPPTTGRKTASGGENPSPPAPVGEVRTVEVDNTGAVQNGPSVASAFTIDAPAYLKSIRTYHYNGGQGSAPGTIALRHEDGRAFGPWSAAGLANLSGKSGPPSLYWLSWPQIVLPAGTYTVIDSDPATWATNAQAGNRGFFTLEWQAVSQ